MTCDYHGWEPTFVSVDDMDGLEWNYAALGEKKRKRGQLCRNQAGIRPRGLLHWAGQVIQASRCRAGPDLPVAHRWLPAVARCKLLAERQNYGHKYTDAQAFIRVLTARLGLHRDYVIAAYEDVWDVLRKEQDVPVNFDPLQRNLADPAERSRLAHLLQGEMTLPVGFVLPLEPARATATGRRWRSSLWPLRREHLYLIPGDSAWAFASARLAAGGRASEDNRAPSLRGARPARPDSGRRDRGC
jgi:uncharacterized protein (DUF2126 family)